ncbi:ribonuclease H-like domain-containing protein [Tanacetum coccineum]
MVTRFHVGTNRPTQRFNLHVSTISPIPKSYPIAFRDPNWYRTMLDEYTALIKNNTWILVPRPPDANIVRFMWLFLHKYNADGTLSRYKARLVANGSTQLAGLVSLCIPPESLNVSASRRSYYGVKCEESVAVVSDVKQAKTVKDVSPHEFVTGYAAHLKRSTPGLKLTAAEECLSCMCLFDMCTCMSDTWVYLKLELASSEAMLRINLEIGDVNYLNQR